MQRCRQEIVGVDLGGHRQVCGIPPTRKFDRDCVPENKTKKQGKIQRTLLASLFFSAMPPLEAVKSLVSIMMSVSWSIRRKPLKLRHYDISKAHFQRTAQRLMQALSAAWLWNFAAVSSVTCDSKSSSSSDSISVAFDQTGKYLDIELDLRHAPLIISEPGCIMNTEAVSTPREKLQDKMVLDGRKSPILKIGDVTRYRSACMRLVLGPRHLRLCRNREAFGQRMSEPRYLVGKPKLLCDFEDKNTLSKSRSS